jgi:hypothetical protein
MTNDLIDQLLSDAEAFTGDFDTVALPGPLANKRADRLRQAAAHIEALAERVRELEGALDVIADDASPFNQTGEPLSVRIAKDLTRRIELARQARKDKEND